MSKLVYRVVLWAVLPLLLLWFLPQVAFRRKYREGFLARLAILDANLAARLRGLDRPLWIHAVSVGEFLAAKPLLDEWRKAHPERPLVVSCTTLTGRELARRELPEEIPVVQFPLDLWPLPGRLLDLVRPGALVLMETELWPEMLFAAERRQVPVVQLNGRLSDRGYRRMRALGTLPLAMLDRVSKFGMQSAEDADRIRALGVPEGKVSVIGNFKFDRAWSAAQHPSPRWTELEEALATAGGRRWLVIGSTHPGEDEPLLTVFRELRTREAGLRCLIAPRHPERSGDIAAIAGRMGLTVVRRTALTGPVDVVILDTIGELAGAYRLAAAAIVGGSFIPHGGQNPLEPAAFGKIVFCGPSMENFRDAVRVLRERGGIVQVSHPMDLLDKLMWVLDNAEEASRIGSTTIERICREAGAVHRAIALLETVVGNGTRTGT